MGLQRPGDLRVALSARGVRCQAPRVCCVCGWIFAATRKATALLCVRCGHEERRRHRGASAVEPIMDATTGAVTDWQRWDLATCDCGRVFSDTRRMSARGRRQARCRNCTYRGRRLFQFGFADGTASGAVSTSRADGTMIGPLWALDGVIETCDPEDAEALRRLPSLRELSRQKR